jgi:hypothetical protein
MASVTSQAPTASAPSDVAVAPREDGLCAACPHPLAAHDTISLRFCSATEAQASTTRGCVCPSN